MFRVKICGVTSVEDAVCAVEAGADAIGLNFYEKSPRWVGRKRAGEIASVIHPDSHAPRRHAYCVGVFVNSDFATIESVDLAMYLSSVQFHGDESPEFLTHFARPDPPAWKVIRARRFGARGVSEIVDDLEACRRAGRIPDAILVDAMTHGHYGGTGETVSWVGLADHGRWLGETPLILAGGLTPDNVAEAIRIVRPAAVDVASGVESAPGKKDPAKVRDFVVNALGAFEALGK